jgi:hypothetical protein
MEMLLALNLQNEVLAKLPRHADLPTRPILAYFSDIWPKFRPQYDLRQKNTFFSPKKLLIDENDPLNRFILSKMQNYVSFCLINCTCRRKKI